MFYWSITDGATSIYLLDLRNATDITTVTPVIDGSVNRKRKKRNTVIDVTQALALNPIGNKLLVSDKASGNIFQCLPDFVSCSEFVNRLTLESNSGRMDVGEYIFYLCTLSLIETVHLCRFARW